MKKILIQSPADSTISLVKDAKAFVKSMIIPLASHPVPNWLIGDPWPDGNRRVCVWPLAEDIAELLGEALVGHDGCSEWAASDCLPDSSSAMDRHVEADALIRGPTAAAAESPPVLSTIPERTMEVTVFDDPVQPASVPATAGERGMPMQGPPVPLPAPGSPSFADFIREVVKEMIDEKATDTHHCQAQEVMDDLIRRVDDGEPYDEIMVNLEAIYDGKYEKHSYFVFPDQSVLRTSFPFGAIRPGVEAGRSIADSLYKALYPIVRTGGANFGQVAEFLTKEGGRLGGEIHFRLPDRSRMKVTARSIDLSVQTAAEAKTDEEQPEEFPAFEAIDPRICPHKRSMHATLAESCRMMRSLDFGDNTEPCLAFARIFRETYLTLRDEQDPVLQEYAVHYQTALTLLGLER